MLTPALMLAWGLVVAGPDAPPVLQADPTPAELAAYEAGRAAAGKDPAAQVKLALWCESHGLKAERVRHLALAVLADPGNAAARGLMGLVAYNGGWKRPEAVSDQVRTDPALAAKLGEYSDRRARAPETADGQWALALWCEAAGLGDEAKAHFTAVARLDPNRVDAWKKLGRKKVGRRWLTDADQTAEKTEADAQRLADRHWKPLLVKWRSGLNSKIRAKRDEARGALAGVTDPRAVPSIWAVFGTGKADDQATAVGLLTGIDAVGASRALAALAVFGGDAEVRRAAAETILRRDPRDAAGVMVGWLRDPIRYEVKDVQGPGRAGELLVKGKAANLKRIYTPEAPPALRPGDVLTTNDLGLPVVNRTVGYRLEPFNPKSASSIQMKGFANQIPEVAKIPVGEMMLDAERSAAVAEAQLESDLAQIEGNNAPILQADERIRAVLARFTGRDLGEDINAWKAWQTDLDGFKFVAQKVSQETPTLIEQVPISYTPQSFQVNITEGPAQLVRVHQACFGAGTAVRTLTGPRLIETIHAGDRVLTQDGKTGALSYQPVVMAYHNPPNETLKIDLGGEPVVVTPIHRFWKAGKGWVMARELTTGDRVRSLEGTATVSAVTADRTQPVFNLEVAEGASFFVGDLGVLVHDNSAVLPTPEPFDAPAAVAVAAGSANP